MSTHQALEDLFRSSPPWIMGILNLSPDSFSDGGDFSESKDVQRRMAQLFSEGAAVVDIGGEATGPGTGPISTELEIARLAAAFPLPPDRVVSIDTYKSETARFALEKGARIINDTSALQADPKLGAVVADHDAFLVLMHSKAKGSLPHADDQPRRYNDVVKEIADYLDRRIEIALQAGIAESRLIVDPGMGKFISNDPQDSWTLLSRFEEFCKRMQPFPVLIGTSRKGFLGGKLSERDAISQQTGADAVRKGAVILRTHNVVMAREYLKCG